MAHIFLSYSRKDLPAVDKIAKYLTSKNIPVWIDRMGIAGGDQWRRQIVDAIESADAFLLVLSPNSVVSDNVRKEIDLAETYKKRIIPVEISLTDIPRELSYQLIGIQRVDLIGNLDQKLSNMDTILSPYRQSQPVQEKGTGQFSKEQMEAMVAQGKAEKEKPKVFENANVSESPDDKSASPSFFKKIPLWGWIAGGALLIVLLVVLINSLSGGGDPGIDETAFDESPTITATIDTATDDALASQKTEEAIAADQADQQTQEAAAATDQANSGTPATETPQQGEAFPGFALLFASLRSDNTDQDTIYIFDGLDPAFELPVGEGANFGRGISPDGSQLAFSSDRSGTWQIYIYDFDTGEITQLTYVPEEAQYPVWSPDGEWIAFNSLTQSDTDESDIFRIRPDGTELSRLTSGFNAVQPSWFPDSQTIAFSAVFDNSTNDIVILSPESGLENITSTNDRDEIGPVVSPDGAWIVFSVMGLDTNEDGTIDENDTSDLYHIFLDEAYVEQLTFTPTVSEWDPSYSFDGSAIVYGYYPIDNVNQLWIMNTDGSEQQMFYDGMINTWYPAIIPYLP